MFKETKNGTAIKISLKKKKLYKNSISINIECYYKYLCNVAESFSVVDLFVLSISLIDSNLSFRFVLEIMPFISLDSEFGLTFCLSNE